MSLLLAAEAPAADAPPAQTAPADDEADSSTPGVEGATGASSEDEALAEEIRAAAATAAPADNNEPFVPTVQISEDLSVSFPVDI